MESLGDPIRISRGPHRDLMWTPSGSHGDLIGIIEDPMVSYGDPIGILWYPHRDPMGTPSGSFEDLIGSYGEPSRKKKWFCYGNKIRDNNFFLLLQPNVLLIEL